MKNKKRMSVMLSVRTENCNYLFFCDEYESQESDFAKKVALCELNGIPYTTDVVLFAGNDKIIERFGCED